MPHKQVLFRSIAPEKLCTMPYKVARFNKALYLRLLSFA